MPRDPSHAAAAPAAGSRAAAMPRQRIRRVHGPPALARRRACQGRRLPDRRRSPRRTVRRGRRTRAGIAPPWPRGSVSLAAGSTPGHRACRARGARPCASADCVTGSVKHARAAGFVDLAGDEPGIGSLGSLEHDGQPIRSEVHIIVEHRYPSAARRFDASVECLADALVGAQQDAARAVGSRHVGRAIARNRCRLQ